MSLNAFQLTLGLALAGAQIVLAQSGFYPAAVQYASLPTLSFREPPIASSHLGVEGFKGQGNSALRSRYPYAARPGSLPVEASVNFDASAHGSIRTPTSLFSFESPWAASNETNRFSASQLLGSVTRATGLLLGPDSRESILTLSAQHPGSDRCSLGEKECWSACCEAEVDYFDELPLVQRLSLWHIRMDDGLSYTFPRHEYHLVLASVYGFDAPHDIDHTAHGLGIMFRFDFALFKQARQSLR